MNFNKKAQVKRVSDNISFGKYKLNVNQMHRNYAWKMRWEKLVNFVKKISGRKTSIANLLNNETTKRFIPEKFYDNPYFNAFLVYVDESKIRLKVQNPKTLEVEALTIKDEDVFENEDIVKEKYYFAFDFVFADESKVQKIMDLIESYIKNSNISINNKKLECVYIDYVQSSDVFTIRVDTNIEVPNSPEKANKIETGKLPDILREIHSKALNIPSTYKPIEISNVEFSPTTKPTVDLLGKTTRDDVPSTTPPKTIDIDLGEEEAPLSIRRPQSKQPTAQSSLNRIIKLARKFSNYLN